MARAIFNRIKIETKLAQSLKQNRFEGLARNAANTRFVFAKQDLLEEFQNHPVTQEILAGPSAEGGLLPKGNVFSYIGFYQSDTPILDLENYLQTNIKLNPRPNFIQNKRNVIYEFEIKIPTLQQIYSNKLFASPDNWSSDSWPRLIEKGINNFNYYIFLLVGNFSSGSRSGTGLQNNRSKNKSGGKVLGIPYLSEIFSNFKARFSGR